MMTATNEIPAATINCIPAYRRSPAVEHLHEILRVTSQEARVQILQHLADVLAMDDGLPDQNENCLQAKCHYLEKGILDRKTILATPEQPKDTQWATKRNVEKLSNPDYVQEVMDQVQQRLQDILSPLRDVQLIPGKPKNEQSIQRKLEKKGLPDRRYLFDLIRFRAVCSNLQKIEEVGQTLQAGYANLKYLRNFFVRPGETVREHFRAINYSFVEDMHDSEEVFEVQVLTQRTLVKSHIDHAFNVAGSSRIEDHDTLVWFRNFVWKSNVLDYLDYPPRDPSECIKRMQLSSRSSKSP